MGVFIVPLGVHSSSYLSQKHGSERKEGRRDRAHDQGSLFRSSVGTPNIVLPLQIWLSFQSPREEDFSIIGQRVASPAPTQGQGRKR